MPNKPSYYHLFLDDCRKPKDVTWVELPPYNWVIVRSYKEFVETIKQKGVPTTVSFDHDLADEHYAEYARVHAVNPPLKIDYTRFNEKTGYECAQWLTNYCVDNNVEIPYYYLHTLNAVGRMNIFSVMENGRKRLTMGE